MKPSRSCSSFGFRDYSFGPSLSFFGMGHFCECGLFSLGAKARQEEHSPIDAKDAKRHSPRSFVKLLGVARGFGTSWLRSGKACQQLTHSCFPVGDGEKQPPVGSADAHIWRTMANAETNRETDNARNVGQMALCRRRYAVNKLRVNRCRE